MRKLNPIKIVVLFLFLSQFPIHIIFARGDLVSAADDTLFIDQQGNVGIGTNKPTATLEVVGKIKTQELGNWGHP